VIALEAPASSGNSATNVFELLQPATSSANKAALL
jgi:hypothetical protein